MRRTRRAALILVAITIILLNTMGTALGHDGQHGTDDGHLLGEGDWARSNWSDRSRFTTQKRG
jgi:hypothetical protein